MCARRGRNDGRRVALLAEGVDRNYSDNLAEDVRRGSPSSRRAWIEIGHPPHRGLLRGRSPSSRRAWIEIYMESKQGEAQEVALLAEGVDRNILS